MTRELPRPIRLRSRASKRNSGGSKTSIGHVDIGLHGQAGPGVDRLSRAQVLLGHFEALKNDLRGLGFGQRVDPALTGSRGRQLTVRCDLEAIHGLNAAGAGLGGFDIDDPAFDVQHVDESLDPDSADLPFDVEFHGGGLDVGRHFVKVLPSQRLTCQGKLRRIFVVAKLGMLALECPGLAKKCHNASERKVLVGFNLLGEVLGEGPVHGSAQSQIPVGRVGVLERVFEPPAGMAVHETSDLTGGKNRRR